MRWLFALLLCVGLMTAAFRLAAWGNATGDQPPESLGTIGKLLVTTRQPSGHPDFIALKAFCGRDLREISRRRVYELQQQVFAPPEGYFSGTAEERLASYRAAEEASQAFHAVWKHITGDDWVTRGRFAPAPLRAVYLVDDAGTRRIAVAVRGYHNQIRVLSFDSNAKRTGSLGVTTPDRNFPSFARIEIPAEGSDHFFVVYKDKYGREGAKETVVFARGEVRTLKEESSYGRVRAGR